MAGITGPDGIAKVSYAMKAVRGTAVTLRQSFQLEEKPIWRNQKIETTESAFMLIYSRCRLRNENLLQREVSRVWPDRVCASDTMSVVQVGLEAFVARE